MSDEASNMTASDASDAPSICVTCALVGAMTGIEGLMAEGAQARFPVGNVVAGSMLGELVAGGISALIGHGISGLLGRTSSPMPVVTPHGGFAEPLTS